MKVGPEERGARLARLVGERRGLLVLDGLEPLQYPPGPLHGQLHDKGVAALLKGLAGHNAGLCVVTTREKVDEIKQHYGRSAIDHSLEYLSPEAGAALLHHSGAQRAGDKYPIAVDDEELQEASREVQGHALTLFLIGQYLKLALKRAQRGDIRQRDRIKLADADKKYVNDATRPYGHAFKAIEAYERWLEGKDEGGRRTDEGLRQLAILRLLGLFDRPASEECLTALRAKPVIPGLTESLVDCEDEDWNSALSWLEENNLVGVNADGSVDCHPLLREYFAVQLRRPDQAERRSGNAPDDDATAGAASLRSSIRPTGTTSEAWRAGHRRVYEHLCASTQEGDAPTLEALQPLYQAVAHGCQAGLQQDACDNVYYARIARGNEAYAMRKLGAFGSELAAVSCFFESPWIRVSPALTAADQAWLLNQAATGLRALGRLTEAVEPMRAGMEMKASTEYWKNAAAGASNLSELEVTLGEVSQAERDAAQSVTYADRSGDAFQRSTKRTTHADALHQAGRRAEAVALFREAEQMQAERQPDYPLLYSLPGFRYCDLLLTEAERAAWIVAFRSAKDAQDEGRSFYEAKGDYLKVCSDVSHRSAQTLKWSESNLGLLTIALDHLTLGRATFYASILESGMGFQPVTAGANHGLDARATWETARRELEAAVTGLRRAGAQEFIVRGLLTRAWQRFLSGQTIGLDSAQSDLDEAWEIAERGSMKLFLADIHLYRARLFGVRNSECGVRNEESQYPWDRNPDGTPRGPLDDLAAAEKLINDCGYHRRDEELADAKAALLQ